VRPQHASRVLGVTNRYTERRVIERCPLVAHAVFRERFQELHDLRTLLLIQANVAHTWPEVAARGHVTVPRVELEDLLERCGAAGVEVRSPQLHIAKCR